MQEFSRYSTEVFSAELLLCSKKSGAPKGKEQKQEKRLGGMCDWYHKAHSVIWLIFK